MIYVNWWVFLFVKYGESLCEQKIREKKLEIKIRKKQEMTKKMLRQKKIGKIISFNIICVWRVYVRS